MEKIITYETLRNFAYCNDHLIHGEVKGIMLGFMGLNANSMYSNDGGDAREWAERGIIYVIPYCNPWSWMNRQTVALTDEIIAVLCQHYHLGRDVKVVSTGVSMGGLSALVYCAYAEIVPVACVVNCPVCDLPYHFTERPDLPRTLYSAFSEYACTLDDAMRSCSPLHLVDRMPDIPYTIFHCGNDLAVNLQQHSARFVEKMKAEHRIVLHEVPLRGHGDLSPAARIAYEQAVLEAIFGSDGAVASRQ